MKSVREFLQGKKAYITAVIGIAGALLAWSQGQIDTPGFLAAIWAALSVIFIRAGVATEAKRTK